MDDDEMDCLAEALLNNTSLEGLQVEDNNLGPQSLSYLSHVLQTNTKLTSLSLEGNNLTQGPKQLKLSHQILQEDSFTDPTTTQLYQHNGITDFAQALAANTTLMHLNLSGCNLTPQAATLLADAIDQNRHVIMVDISRNPAIPHRTLKRITQKLKQNYQQFQQERVEEFRERKFMKENYEFKRERENLRKENFEVIEAVKNDVFRLQKLKERMFFEEREKNQKEKDIMMKKLFKDAQLRAMKKKRKKKSG